MKNENYAGGNLRGEGDTVLLLPEFMCVACAFGNGTQRLAT